MTVVLLQDHAALRQHVVLPWYCCRTMQRVSAGQRVEELEADDTGNLSLSLPLALSLLALALSASVKSGHSLFHVVVAFQSRSLARCASACSWLGGRALAPWMSARSHQFADDLGLGHNQRSAYYRGGAGAHGSQATERERAQFHHAYE